jgi:hypothetical protein
MSKMAEVAKILGVELDEVFDVEDGFRGEMDKTIVCRLTEKGLQTCVRVISCRGDITEKWVGDGMLLSGLLCDNDRFTIVRKPWRPKKYDAFWTYYGEDFQPCETIWDGYPADCARLKSGMVFRTEKEAIAERPRVYKEMTGKEWRET